MIVVIGASLIAYAVTDMTVPVEDRPIHLTNKIPGGLPDVASPPFSIDVCIPSNNASLYQETALNRTSCQGTTETKSFLDILQSIGVGIILIPLYSFLQSIAIAKSFGKSLLLKRLLSTFTLYFCYTAKI